MRETPEDTAELQRLVDRTMANINPHFAAIVTPKRRLTAQQVCAYLQGTRIVAFSTVNAKGRKERSLSETTRTRTHHQQTASRR